MATDVKLRALLLFALERERIESSFAPRKNALSRSERRRSAVVGMRASAVRQVLATHPRPDIVISVGIAGGLRDGLNVGDVVAPTEVVSDDGRRWPSAVFGEQSGRLLTVRQPLLGIEAKRRAGIEHAADVVDMEAAVIADVCAAAGLPFAAVKAVCDPVDVALPAELLEIAPDGAPRYGRLLIATARRPGLIMDLIRLNRASRQAARAACECVCTE